MKTFLAAIPLSELTPSQLSSVRRKLFASVTDYMESTGTYNPSVFNTIEKYFEDDVIYLSITIN